MLIRIFIIFYVLSNILFAQLPKDLDLEATYIRYKNNNKILIASENVILKYQDFTITSNTFIYDIEKQYVSFPETLHLFNSDYNLQAKSFEFDFNNKKGSMKDFTVTTEELIFNSKLTTFSLEDIRFKQCYFTTCKEASKAYYFTSKSMRVLPIVGYLTARNNTFKFKYFPFSIPIPFYFYGSPNNSILNNNPYLPEIGVNKTEGFFVTYKTTYIPSYKSTGSFDFGYTENLNYNIGGSNFYNQSDSINHSINYKFYPNDGFSSFSYKSKYSISLENKIRSKIKSKRKNSFFSNSNLNFIDIILRNFKSKKDIPILDATFSIEKNQLINDYWVSYYPKILLAAKQLPTSKYSVDLTTQYAYTEENNKENYDYESFHFQFSNIVKRDYMLSKSLNLNTSLLNNINIYKNSTYWSRIFLIFSLEKNILLNPKFTLYQKLFVEGESPFDHQNKYAINNNEIGLSIGETFNDLKISSDMFFKLNTLSFRELNISVFKEFQCWGYGLSWSVKRNSFNILISL